MKIIIISIVVIAIVVILLIRQNRNTKAALHSWLSESGRPWCVKHIDSPECKELLSPLSTEDISKSDMIFAIKLIGRFEALYGLDTIVGLSKPTFIYGLNSKTVPLVTIWYDATESTEYIAIRGTENFQDLITDLNYSEQTQTIWKNCNAHIHSGFLKLYLTIKDKLHETIKPTVKHIFITGHSLGAALTYLAGYDIAEKHADIDVSVYAIAPPKTGDSNFVKCIASTPNLHIKSLMNLTDMITTIVLSFAPNFDKKNGHKPYNFSHVYPLYMFNIDSTDILSNHSLPVYLDGAKTKLVGFNFNQTM